MEAVVVVVTLLLLFTVHPCDLCTCCSCSKELKPTVDEDPTFGLVPRDLLREKHFENKFVAGDQKKFWYQEEQAVVSTHAQFTDFCKIDTTFTIRF